MPYYCAGHILSQQKRLTVARGWVLLIEKLATARAILPCTPWEGSDVFVLGTRSASLGLAPCCPFLLLGRSPYLPTSRCATYIESASKLPAVPEKSDRVHTYNRPLMSPNPTFGTPDIPCTKYCTGVIADCQPALHLTE